MGLKKLLNWKVILVVIVFLVIFSNAAIKHTSHPDFCASCHVMDEPYASWEASAHSEVNCMDCHSDGGLVGTMETKINGLKELYLTVTDNIPEEIKSEVPNHRCTDCHEEAAIPDQPGAIVYPHEFHSEAFDLECTDCHEAGHARNLEYYQGPDKGDCIACHDVEDADSCITCHSAEDIPKEINGIKYTHEYHAESFGLDNCADCHSVETNADFEVEGPKHRDCIACHDFEDPSECSTCHTDF